MTITLNIPDELVPAVLRILQEKSFPDDDGRTECWIMGDLNLSGEQFIRAENIVDSIRSDIEEQYNGKP